MNFKPFHFSYLSLLVLHSLTGCVSPATSPSASETTTAATSLSKGSLAKAEGDSKEVINAKKIAVEIYNKSGKSGGTAFILEVVNHKTYLLTAAHLLADKAQPKLNIFFYGDQDAKIVKVDDKHNLALLMVENDELSSIQVTHYLAETQPLTAAHASPFTIGFPTQGKPWTSQQLSYLGFKNEHLVFAQHTLDDGNLGGPVIEGHQIIGMLAGFSNGAYVVPATVIRKFLHDVGSEGQDILAAHDRRRPPVAKETTPPVKSATAPTVASPQGKTVDKPQPVASPQGKTVDKPQPATETKTPPTSPTAGLTPTATAKPTTSEVKSATPADVNSVAAATVDKTPVVMPSTSSKKLPAPASKSSAPTPPPEEKLADSATAPKSSKTAAVTAGGPEKAKEVKPTTAVNPVATPAVAAMSPQSEMTTLNALCGAIATNDWSTFRKQAKLLDKDSRLFYPASSVTQALSLEDQKMVLEQTLKFLFEAFLVSKNEKESRCGPQLLKVKADELEKLKKLKK